MGPFMKIGHLSIYVGHLLFLSAMSYNLYATSIKLLLNIFLSILFFCVELFPWCFQTVDRSVIDFCMLTLYPAILLNSPAHLLILMVFKK